jgi:hypothetical protein
MAAVEAVESTHVPTPPDDVEMTAEEAGASETNGAAANGGETRAGTDEAVKGKALKQSTPPPSTSFMTL